MNIKALIEIAVKISLVFVAVALIIAIIYEIVK